jgi:photosystem I subunit 2
MFAISSSALTPRATVANATRTRRSTTARRSTAIRAEAEGAKAAPAAPKAWTAPKLNPNTPSPIFGGSTGGLLRKAQVRERRGDGERARRSRRGRDTRRT